MSLRRPSVARTAFIFCYKPFMWCRPDARLWHYYSAVSSRGVIHTLVWHQYYYFCSFLSRSHSDTRLAPVLLFLQFPLEESFRPSFGTQYLLSLCLNALERVHMLHVYICYILCPNCLASTFIVLIWLVDLARC